VIPGPAAFQRNTNDIRRFPNQEDPVNAAPSGVNPHHSRLCPVFVLGHARSGTSLMCRLLRDHLRINFGTESQFIVRYQQRLARYGDLRDERRMRWLLEELSHERFFARSRQNFGFVFDIDRAVRAIEPRSYAGAVRGVFEQFAASQGMVRWGDKTPEYCRHLPLVHSLFPDAQFVHVVRDGRAVARSSFKLGFGPKNAYEAAIEWGDTLRDIASFRDTLPASAFLQVRYEDLLEDPVATMASIAAFLGVDNHTEVIEGAAPHLRAWVRQENASKWKQHLSWREIECFEAFAGAELEANGYERQFRPRRGRHSALEAVLWRAQAASRRLTNRRYWLDNWYKAGVRLRDATMPLRAMARQRQRDVWPIRDVRP
jgi:hypothetical protein